MRRAIVLTSVISVALIVPQIGWASPHRVPIGGSALNRFNRIYVDYIGQAQPNDEHRDVGVGPPARPAAPRHVLPGHARPPRASSPATPRHHHR